MAQHSYARRRCGRYRRRPAQHSNREVRHSPVVSIPATGGRTTRGSPLAAPPGQLMVVAAAAVKRGVELTALEVVLVAEVAGAPVAAGVALAAAVASEGAAAGAKGAVVTVAAVELAGRAAVALGCRRRM